MVDSRDWFGRLRDWAIRRKDSPNDGGSDAAPVDNFSACLAVTLHHEGGWSDHPKDPGKATNQGVTLKTYSEYLKRQATADELRRITNGELQEIYRGNYWRGSACDRLPSGVDLVVFDMAVNAGPGKAIQLLQSVLHVPIDGRMGPQTLGAVEKSHPLHLIQAYSEERRRYYKSRPMVSVFGKGWLRRTDEVEKEAITMAEKEK